MRPRTYKRRQSITYADSPPPTGASPGSSSLLYSSLVRQLSGPTSGDSDAASSRPCLVSRLTSRDCSNIKNALRSLIGGFIGSDLDVELEDDEDEDEEVFVRPVTRFRRSSTA